MSKVKRVALATFRSLPDWEKDDEPLVAALEERGVEVCQPAWDSTDEDWARHDVCLLRTTWDYQERFEEFLQWIERVSSQTRLLNPPEVVEWNVRKSYLRELEENGARCIPTLWLERGQPADLSQLITRAGWTRGFVKPVVGANARETYRFDAGQLDQVQAEVDRLLEQESLMLQPYLSTVETQGEVSIIFFNGEFSHGVRKIPKSGDYRVQDDWGASDEPWSPSEQELRDARRILRHVESSCSPEVSLLYARLDFLFLENGELGLNEVELIEPSLFFRHSSRAGARLADALLERCST